MATKGRGKGMTHTSNDGSLPPSLSVPPVGEFSSGGENNARERERERGSRVAEDPGQVVATFETAFHLKIEM